MIRDVFYYGKKPNVHPRERFAESFEHAKSLATTEHFWIINEFCNYKNFDWEYDFDFLPDDQVWTEDHINIWPSQHQKDSGTWLCANNDSDIKIYLNVEPIIRKNEILDGWIIHEDIEEFDFSWHPDPTDPPYIYQWGNYYYPSTIKPTIEYVVPGATQIKHLNQRLRVKPSKNWVEFAKVDETKFDICWRPSPLEPPYIYIWGNKYIPAEIQSTIEYHVPGAIDKKYMGSVEVLPELDRWVEVQNIDKTKFDMSWRPDPREPAYIYTWGNKYIPAEIKPTLEYKTPGATERKYMGDVEVLPELDRWVEVQNIDKTKFDMSWRPDPREPAYIYIWGNKYISGELKSTLEYHVPGAIDKKYMGDVEVLPELDRWVEVQNIDKTKFDLSWRPDPREPAYIYTWGNKYIPAEIKPTLEYHYPNATQRKYMGEVEVIPEWEKYKILFPVDKTKFDFSWRPDPREPAFIYIWGNQHNSAEIEPTIEYHVPGATEIKYIHDAVASILPVIDNYKILIPVDNFDFSWRPDPHSPPYIYVFGNQWYDVFLEPTLEYHVPGATDKKYITDMIANAGIIPERWKTLIPVDNFDYSWRPHPHDPPHIYVFGNQWHDAIKEPTIEYHVPGATEIKYIMDIKAIIKPDMTKWKTLIPVDKFDYSWRPDPDSPPYIYVFGNQWFDAIKEPTVEYHVPGATEKKYILDIKAIVSPDMSHWKITYQVENFDYSWRPDPDAPPMIYQFGTILDDIHLEDGPIYTVPNNDGTVVYLDNKIAKKSKIIYPKYYIKTTLEDLIEEHPNEIFWALQKNINYDKFNFDWIPTKENVFHINVFGSTESSMTQTYFVNGPMIKQGYMQKNYIEDIKLDDEYLATLFKPIDMFFVDRGNIESNNRFEDLKTKFPNIQKTRYLNTWVDTINRCLKKCNTELCWILNSELDYSEFNFEYYPNPWQMKMVHVFGTQWSHWGTTFIVNKENFPEDTKYIKIIEHLPNINFVKKTKAKATNILYDIVLIDHGNLTNKDKEGKLVVEYEVDYLTTFSKILKLFTERKDHYIWVISSICDYSTFDFTYICDPFAKDQLHVFPSDKQKFGDTFLVDVNKLRNLIKDMRLLDDYIKINFNQHQRVRRINPPIFTTTDDTLTNAIFENYNFPYAIFKTSDNNNIELTDTEPMSLWTKETKNIIVTSTGATQVIVPKEAKDYVKKELYDYPYLTKKAKLEISNPLDIVFLSNGEKNADKNYEHLLKLTHGLKNRVVRVDGVNGRVNAYHAAAKASNTPWMFTVFAKLEVDNNFDWNWQPDRLQIPKHYIFTALNPVNELVYGHQAMIAYNKKIVLSNMGKGLDFTLDDEHEVVDMLSGVARYNTDEWTTWRTAFREALKLRADISDASIERLDTWLTVGNGDFGNFSIKGANDAVEYYEQVNGDFEKLKLSYDWDWLKERFNK